MATCMDGLPSLGSGAHGRARARAARAACLSGAVPGAGALAAWACTPLALCAWRGRGLPLMACGVAVLIVWRGGQVVRNDLFLREFSTAPPPDRVSPCRSNLIPRASRSPPVPGGANRGAAMLIPPSHTEGPRSLPVRRAASGRGGAVTTSHYRRHRLNDDKGSLPGRPLVATACSGCVRSLTPPRGPRARPGQACHSVRAVIRSPAPPARCSLPSAADSRGLAAPRVGRASRPPLRPASCGGRRRSRRAAQTQRPSTRTHADVCCRHECAWSPRHAAAASLLALGSLVRRLENLRPQSRTRSEEAHAHASFAGRSAACQAHRCRAPCQPQAPPTGSAPGRST